MAEEHSAENGLPVLCDERGDRCCGTPACLNAGLWKSDPYDEPIGVFEGTRWHMHAEPICADPECVTYLTRSAVATMRARTRVTPPASNYLAPDGYRYGVMFNDGSVGEWWNGRTQRDNAQAAADRLAVTNAPDRITLARRRPDGPWERVTDASPE